MSSYPWRLLAQLTVREIRAKLSYSSLGVVWIVLTPLALLGVYSVVFGLIFNVRVPEGLGVPFVVWLAVALWPWLAFSEGVMRAAGSIRQYGALISKVPIERSLFVWSVLNATFVLHFFGYLVVLSVIGVLGIDLQWHAIPHLILVMATLYLLSLGLSLLLAACQVFIRDLEQLLPITFTLWFFLTPIIYAPQLLPDSVRGYLYLNPITWWVEEVRAGLLDGQWLPDATLFGLLVLSSVMLVVGAWVFQRTSPFFEDFL